MATVFVCLCPRWIWFVMMSLMMPEIMTIFIAINHESPSTRRRDEWLTILLTIAIAINGTIFLLRCVHVKEICVIHPFNTLTRKQSLKYLHLSPCAVPVPHPHTLSNCPCPSHSLACIWRVSATYVSMCHYNTRCCACGVTTPGGLLIKSDGETMSGQRPQNVTTGQLCRHFIESYWPQMMIFVGQHVKTD